MALFIVSGWFCVCHLFQGCILVISGELLDWQPHKFGWVLGPTDWDPNHTLDGVVIELFLVKKFTGVAICSWCLKHCTLNVDW